MNHPVLTEHEVRLMEDFKKRAKGMNKLNLIVGIAGVIASFVLFLDSWLSTLIGALSGALIGVALEKRYLGEMRAIMEKLYEAGRDQ